MAKLANYGDLPSGFARFFTLGEDKDRLELSVQGERSLKALTRFGGEAFDDTCLPIYRQLRQLFVREVLASHAAEKGQTAIGIGTFGTSGIEDQCSFAAFGTVDVALFLGKRILDESNSSVICVA